MKNQKQPNFQKIIQSLMEIGMSQREIAEAAGVSQPTVSHIYQSVWSHKQPLYRTATAILTLAEKNGVRPDGSKDSKRHPRKSWTPMPPPPSKNKIVLARG